MAEYIRVQGDKENICNCIDFYQGLTKAGLVGVKELRKSYLDMYLDDYIQRCKKTLKKRTEKKVVDTSVVNIPVESTPVENTPVKEESGINLFRNILNTPEEIIYLEHGVFIDENTVTEKEENTPVPVKEEVEYINHGVFLEEVDVPVENIEILTNEVSDTEYVDHGIYVEDIVTDSSESEDEYEEDDYDDEEYDETDYVEEEKEEGDTEDDEEEYVSYKSLNGNRVVEDYDDDDDFEFLDYKDVTPVKEEVIEEPKVVSPVEKEESEVLKPKEAMVEVRETVEKLKVQDYKNVRDFVKKNPGCSYSDVKEFFSMKEIQKALLNTKIVEKKNKLYVV